MDKPTKNNQPIKQAHHFFTTLIEGTLNELQSNGVNLADIDLKLDDVEIKNIALPKDMFVALMNISVLLDQYLQFLKDMQKDVSFDVTWKSGKEIYADTIFFVYDCFNPDEQSDGLSWLRMFYSNFRAEIVQLYEYKRDRTESVLTNEKHMVLLLESVNECVVRRFQSFYQIRKTKSNPLFNSTLTMLQTSKRIKKGGKKSSFVQAKRAINAQMTLTNEAATAWEELIKRASQDPTYLEVINAYSLACAENMRTTGKQDKDYPIIAKDLLGFPKYRFLELCNNGEAPPKKQVEKINFVLRDIDHLEDGKGNRLIDLLHNYPDKSGRLISFYPSVIFSRWGGYLIGYIGRLQKACEGKPPKFRAFTYHLSNHLAYKRKLPVTLTKTEIKKAIPAITPSYIDKNITEAIRTLEISGLWKVEQSKSKQVKYTFFKVENDTPPPILVNYPPPFW